MAGSADTVDQVADDRPEAHRRGGLRLFGGVLVVVLMVAGLVVGLLLAGGSSSPTPLTSYYPHRPVIAQSTGNATVRVPPASGRVSITLACRYSREVSARFTRDGRYLFAFRTYCSNGVATDMLQRGAPWPDEATVTSSARGGEWVLLAGRFDHLRHP